MIESDDGSPGNYTFEKHEDEILNDLLRTMYRKLAEIYEKMKKKLEEMSKCEECDYEECEYEEIVSILLKFTLEDFSAWMTTEVEDEEEVDTSSPCQTMKYHAYHEDGEDDSKAHETLENEVFDCGEEEMLDSKVELPE